MSWVVGIDEAGRGPLAGPVAIGVVKAPDALDLLTLFPGLNDSKKLTEKARERIFNQLQERATTGDLSYVVRMPSAVDIDEQGIAVVIRAAIEDVLAELLPQREETTSTTKVWLDGSLRAPAHYVQETIIGGDALIPSIMLASVAAKVTRDRYMVELAKVHPEYGLDRHKGYGTKAHMDAIRTHGLSPIHRKTYIHLDRRST